MMTRKIGLLSLIALAASCGQPAAEGEVASGRPPKRFQGDVTVTVRYVDDIGAACKAAGLKQLPDTITQGCSVLGGGKREMLLANPCKQSGRAAISTCHEIGHINGWPGNHPR